MYDKIKGAGAFALLIFTLNLFAFPAEKSFLISYYGMEKFASLPRELHPILAKFMSLYSPVCIDNPQQKIKKAVHFTQLCFSNNSEMLIAGTNQSIFIFNVETGELIREIQNIVGGLFNFFAVSPNDRILALAQDETLWLYDLKRKSKRSIDIGIPIQRIDYRKDGKLFITPDMDFSCVYIYDPYTNKLERIPLNFLPELKGSLFRINYGDACRQTDKQALDYVTNTLNMFYQKNGDAFRNFSSVLIGNNGKGIIVNKRGIPHSLENDELVPLNTARELGSAEFGSDDGILALCNGLVYQEPVYEDVKYTDLYNLMHNKPLMLMKYTGGWSALSKNRKWIAVTQYAYSVKANGCGQWECAGIVLERLDYLFDQAMNQFLSGKMDLMQTLFIKFLKDLENQGLCIGDLDSIKNGNSTIASIKHELNEVYSTFDPVIQTYIKKRYKAVLK